MNKTLLGFAILCNFSSFGQITLNSTDCATAGNSIFISQTNNLTLDYQLTGPNTTWNYANLVADSQQELEFGAMTGLPILILTNFGSFAPTNYRATYWLPTDIPIDMLSGILPVEISDINQYTRLTADSMTTVGLSMRVSGIGIPTQSDEIETRLKFPLTFGDTHYSEGLIEVDMNPIVDAAFSQDRTRTTTVDGWGSITTPYGTFNALRVKHEITEANTITYQGFTVPIPAINTIEYEWWANGQKVPVLKMTTISLVGNEQLTRVEFLDDEDMSSAGITSHGLENISIYPNPTENEITISSEDQVNSIEIIDLLGNIVISDLNPSLKNAYSLGDLSSGVYQVRITQAGKTQVAKIVKK